MNPPTPKQRIPRQKKTCAIVITDECFARLKIAGKEVISQELSLIYKSTPGAPVGFAGSGSYVSYSQ